MLFYFSKFLAGVVPLRFMLELRNSLRLCFKQ